MMARRIISFFLLALSITAFMQIVAFASWDAMLSQAYINENTMDIFLSTSLDKNSVGVKVANQEATIKNSGTISDEEISVCTTMLVDVSTSIPETARGKVAELIDCTIKKLTKNEQLRIVTFSDEINVLLDFSSDRYDLDKAVDNIKFDGRKSAIYDAIYSTLPKIDLINEKPCFYRTIVITDGADSTKQGITKEELFMKLHSETYPIDVVHVSNSIPSGQNKDLSALSRISNGRYFDIYSESDIIQLCSDLSVSNYFWIRSEVPSSLLDGSTRQVDISNGSDSLSFDMKMSVVDTLIESQSATVVSASSTTNTEQHVYSPVENSTELAITDEGIEKSKFSHEMLIIIILSVLLVVAVSAVLIVVVTNKKKKTAQQSQTIRHTFPDINSKVKISETEIVDESERIEHYSIKLSNVANQNDSWILDVFSDIIIGRSESCAIIIDEKSVSREQCKIVANKSGLAISNLSSSNKTKLNGTVLATEVLLHPADNIHFGRVTLRVDYIQKVTDEIPPSHPTVSISGVDKTQTIF